MAVMAALVATLLLAGTTAADGTGLIGYGKKMYYPLCAAACRGALEGAPLVCTPHETVDTGSHVHGATPAECYASDIAFMQTLAFCMSTHCDRAELGADELETYWTLHLVGGGRVNLHPRPSMGYYDTLETIKEPPTVEYIDGEMLNITSLVSESTYGSQAIALSVFENAETGHSTYRYILLSFSSLPERHTHAMLPVSLCFSRDFSFPSPRRPSASSPFPPSSGRGSRPHSTTRPCLEPGTGPL